MEELILIALGVGWLLWKIPSEENESKVSKIERTPIPEPVGEGSRLLLEKYGSFFNKTNSK